MKFFQLFKRIGVKLVTAFLVIGMLPLLISSFISTQKSSTALTQASFNQLKGVREIKKAQIESFFKERQGDMEVLKETVGTLREEAFSKLEALATVKQNQIQKFFDERIADAEVFASLPFIEEAIGELDRLSKEAKNYGYSGKKLLNYPPYKTAFDKYSTFVKTYMEKYGYYDVFLFSPNSGRIVLSAALEADFGSELKSEQTHLAATWQEMKSEKKSMLQILPPMHRAIMNQPCLLSHLLSKTAIT